MNDQLDNPNERLEGLLRRWGVDEAARNAKVPPAPQPRLTGRPTPAWLRWAPLFAAAALLVAAAINYYQSRKRYNRADQATARMKEKETEAVAAQALVAAYRKELAGVRGGLLRAQADLARAETKLAAETTKYKAAAAQLQTELDEQKTTVADANRRLAELKRGLDTKDQELVKLKEALARFNQVDKALADARKEAQTLQSQLDQQGRKLAAASAEILRVSESARQAAAAQRKVEGELLALRARQEAMLRAFQQVYLSAEAPGMYAKAPMELETGPAREGALVARQLAARRSRMLQRYGQLRPSAKSESTKRLFDTVEVLLTRLDMLHPADVYAAQSLRALVSQSDLTERIDEVLTSAGEPPEIRAWLMEARLILTGVDRVG